MDIKKLNKIQSTAISLSLENIRAHMNQKQTIEENITKMQDQINALLRAVAQELEIPGAEAPNWRLTERCDAFVYHAPEKEET